MKDCQKLANIAFFIGEVQSMHRWIEWFRQALQVPISMVGTDAYHVSMRLYEDMSQTEARSAAHYYNELLKMGVTHEELMETMSQVPVRKHW